MEVVVVGAFLNSVLPKLWDVIKDAHGLRFQIEGDIAYLEVWLPIVDAHIQQHTLQCPSPSSEAVTQMIISTARRLAEDTEECISRFLLYQAHARLRWKMNHSEFAVKIKGFRERLDKIKQELSSLKQVSTTSPRKPQDPHFGKHRFVGMEVPYQQLLELLGCTLPVKGEQPTKTGKGKLKVISIVGFGGSGKTRLARQVYIETGEQFGWKAWVRMEDRNAEEVRKEILNFIGDNTSTSIHSDAKQRYLIVIDDVRTSDHWHTLMEALPDNDVGGRIIVTTTSQPVAKYCSSPGSHVYKMSTLSSCDSLELFSNASNRKFSDAHKAQLSTLLKTCDGLPLALVESAKPFKGKTGVMPIECQKAVRNLCVPEEGTDVTTLTRMQWVLMNKYSGLTSSGARACLLYFHMFPFENPTKRKFLIRQWLAEGLVQRHGLTCSDLDAASDYLQTFSDGNIIQSLQVSSNATIKSCRLPGTMHQFISCKSMSENFVTYASYPNKLAEPNNVRRLSLHDGAADSEACIDGVNVSRLRTLAVSGKACEAIMDFSKYELLRVLDLKEWNYQDELDGICRSKCKGKCKLDKEKKLQDKLKGIWKLVMLKYLGLPGSIGEVPRQIQNLEELETLDVGETENIVELYREVIKLPRLKHLLGRFGLSTTEKPEDCVPKDSRLETLSGFFTKGKAAFPKLMIHMKQLKKVKMWCDFQEDKKNLKDVSTAIQQFISYGTNVPSEVERNLSIDVEGCKARFLESLEASGRLSKLKLHGSLEKVPWFITPHKVVTPPEVPGNASVINFVTPLNGLTALCLSSTTLCGQNPVFPFPLEDGASLLPLLTYLKLDEDELGPLNILKHHFPSLERMCLVSKKSLHGITIEAGALEFLASLHIICKGLDGLAGIQIKHLESLREIALDTQVTNTTKAAWSDAAKGHPNEPCLLFTEAALKTDISINQVQSVSSHRWYRSPLNLLRGSVRRR